MFAAPDPLLALAMMALFSGRLTRRTSRRLECSDAAFHRTAKVLSHRPKSVRPQAKRMRHSICLFARSKRSTKPLWHVPGKFEAWCRRSIITILESLQPYQRRSNIIKSCRSRRLPGNQHGAQYWKTLLNRLPTGMLALSRMATLAERAFSKRKQQTSSSPGSWRVRNWQIGIPVRADRRAIRDDCIGDNRTQ